MKVDINEYAEGAVLLTGLEGAIVGITDEFGPGRRVLYSKDKIIEILQERDGMTWSEAEEFFDYNIKGGYFGEQNPVFLEISLTPIKDDEDNWEYDFDFNSEE
jgi:hypothetical protein